MHFAVQLNWIAVKRTGTGAKRLRPSKVNYAFIRVRTGLYSDAIP